MAAANAASLAAGAVPGVDPLGVDPPGATEPGADEEDVSGEDEHPAPARSAAAIAAAAAVRTLLRRPAVLVWPARSTRITR
jgi:hypothetical protein